MLTVDTAADEQIELADLTMQRREVGGGIAKFDLTLSITDSGDEIAGIWEYTTDLFAEATIQRMAAHFQLLCSGLIAQPERPVASLPLLSEQEYSYLVFARNATAAPSPQAHSLSELFEAQVQARPQALALFFADEQLTYGELERRANQLAHHLQASGVGVETPVGIALERSPVLVIALLAVLKVGGTYVPLDPVLPAERLDYMLSTARVAVILTQQRLLRQLPASPARVIVLDRDWPHIARAPGTALSPSLRPENALYILYTSGSTGRPKGVSVTHRSVINLLSCLAERLAITADDIFLALTSLSFDIAGLEIFLPLLVGARVRLISRDVAFQGNLLLEALQTCGASVMQATPATWKLLLASGWQGNEGLNVLCGGEALTKELAVQLAGRCAMLWNLYGPTETTIWSACWPVPPQVERISLGHPVHNTGIYILNSFLQPVPAGVTGQVYIAGDGLARGYVGQPDLTAACFIPHPFAQTPGARLYMTGDLARLLPDGTFEFLGRMDHQLKLRGFRIELGEIEAALRALPGVRDCVVTVHESVSGSQQLVAYLVPARSPGPAPALLQQALAASLPEYMVPGLFVQLDALPLTAGGKIDRRALPAPEQGRTARPQPGSVQIVQVWDGRETAALAEGCVHELFARQVELRPEAVALLDGDKQITYHELNRRASQLAHALRRLGVGPEVLVGVCLQRSIEMVIGLLGLFKAGGVYLPLAPAYPAKRLSLIMQQAGIAVVLTRQQFLGRLADPGGAQCLCLEPDWSAFADEPESPYESGVSLANLAYVIYTSGSTGVPKGAMVEQRGMVNHLHAKIQALQLCAGDIVAQNAAQSFDISVWQFLAALLVGGRVQIIADDISRDPLALLQEVERCQVTVLETVPSLLQGLRHLLPLHQAELPRLAGLRWLISTGEALSSRLARFWLSHYPTVALMNGYGPTECSDDVSHFVVTSLPEEGESALSIGQAIPQVTLSILDADLAPVPAGTPGELFVSGAGLGRGYLHDGGKTAESFLPNPYGPVPGTRLYRTGDLVCSLPDGSLQFLGRQDSQVKVRGSRIELREIEAILDTHPAVGQSVVLLREGQAGRPDLVAYIVLQAGMQAEARELYSLAKEHLPDAMVPVAFVLLSAFPLNSHGKIDRQALLALAFERGGTGLAETGSGSAIEKILLQVWSQVLGLSQVGIHDNFFELGGDSIVGMLMVLKARDAGLELASRQLFQYQTIAELAQHTTLAGAARQMDEQAEGTAPLTPIQHWFFAHNLSERHHWNQSALLEIQERVDHALLQECLRQLVRTHHALRLRFTSEQADWQQSYADDDAQLSLRVCDLRACPAPAQDDQMTQLANAAQASLNLTEGTLLRALLFALGEQRPARLFLCVHHLAIDIVSWQIVLADLQTLYRQGQRAERLHLPPATTPYLSWARQLLACTQTPRIHQQARRWLALNWAGVRALPTDYAQGLNSESATRALSASLDLRETRILLRDLPKALHAQVSEILLAALALALGQWAELRVQLIDVEGHGREDILPGVDLSRTVGWFTAIVPLCLTLQSGQLTGPLAFADALRSVKEQLRAWPDGGIGYGLLRYLHQDAAIREDFARLPQAEVVFNYEGQSARVITDELFTASADLAIRDRAPANLRTHLLALGASIRQDCLQVEIAYSEQSHTEATVQRLLQAYIDLLRSCLGRGQPAPAGYVPSDFPAARLNQEQLTTLLVTLERQEEQDGNEDE
jgi:amino acid adenylation domain-containing protein/non-ribosomal peptide synthase protein (TIGR01720 family)